MRTLRIPHLLLLGGLAAFAALAAALVSQFVFGLRPCELCLLQRWPYLAAGVIATAAAVAVRTARAARAVLLLLAALFLVEAGIAGYHAGVELGVFKWQGRCSAGELPPGASLEEVRRHVLEAPLVSCKDPAFTFLGLSMAGWNALYAVGGAALCITLLRRRICP